MLKDKKGVTIIEVIITLVIVSLIFTIAYSIYFFGINNFTTQTGNVNNQSDVRYAVSYISKELRKADIVTVNSNELNLDGTVTYRLHNNAIMKNSNVLVDNIDSFVVEKTSDKIYIEISSIPNTNGSTVTLTSEIYIRQ